MFIQKESSHFSALFDFLIETFYGVTGSYAPAMNLGKGKHRQAVRNVLQAPASELRIGTP
jgi:hypothetical protein